MRRVPDVRVARGVVTRPTLLCETCKAELAVSTDPDAPETAVSEPPETAVAAAPEKAVKSAPERRTRRAPERRAR